MKVTVKILHFQMRISNSYTRQAKSYSVLQTYCECSFVFCPIFPYFISARNKSGMFGQTSFWIQFCR